MYTGQFFDADGSFSFAENIDDSVLIRIDGVQRLTNGTWDTATTTGFLWDGLNNLGVASVNANPSGGTQAFGMGTKMAWLAHHRVSVLQRGRVERGQLRLR